MGKKAKEPLYQFRRELVSRWEMRERIEVDGVPLTRPIVPRGPQDLAAYLKPWAEATEEHLLLLTLDSKLRLTGHAVIGQGGLNAVSASNTIVARAAVMSGAAAVILAHNHPTGEVTPSPEDIATTKRLDLALKAVDVPLLDHVIVGLDPVGGQYMLASMKQKGLMPDVK